MVFQKSNPFPKSIYENVAYGCRIQGINKKRDLDEIVERSLRGAALWDEVKDRLHESALGLSGGQQQRLCIARAIAVEPEVILLDEPCSALDPIATARVEELMQDLKTQYTQVIVTHNMQQASRVSDYTAFLYLGELIEFGADREDLHQAGAEADRGLHHRPVRLRRSSSRSIWATVGLAGFFAASAWRALSSLSIWATVGRAGFFAASSWRDFNSASILAILWAEVEGAWLRRQRHATSAAVASEEIMAVKTLD